MKIDNLRKRCCIKSSSSSAEFSISQVESVLVPYLSFEDGFSLCLAAKSLLRTRENIPVVFDGANTSRWDARSIISKLRIFKNAVEIDLQFNRLVATDVLRVLRMIEEGTFPNLRVIRLDWTKSHDSQRKANISIWQILSRLLRGKLDNLVFIDLGSAFIPSGLEGEVMSSLVFRCHRYLDQPDLNPLKRISFDYRSLESRSVTQLARYGIAEATVELGLRYLQGISTSADKTNVERDDKLKYARKAMKLISYGAAHGVVIGQVQLAAFLLKQQNPEAAHWFLSAACQGHVQSQYWMGRLKLQGYLVAQDVEEGHFWLRKAARGGDPKAQQWLYSIELGALMAHGDLRSQTSGETL
mmetsp:Transcript_17936/g.27059  ORF Transcript_17936/g.27059 Transcript_17936/m.27059 type:complete len:356 (+) Transcript_17936:121-1188(+)